MTIVDHMSLFDNVGDDDIVWLGWSWTNGSGSFSTQVPVRTAKEIWMAIWTGCADAEIRNCNNEVLGTWKCVIIYLVFCAENGKPTSFFGSTEFLKDAVVMARRAAKTANFTVAEIWETKLGSSSSSKIRTIHRKDL